MCLLGQTGGEAEGAGFFGWWVVAAVFQGDEIVGGECYLRVEGRCSLIGEKFAVDVNVPAAVLCQLWGEVEFGEAVVPDGQEVVQGHVVNFGRGFDVDDAVAAMGVHPVVATAIGGDADALGNGDGFPIDVDGQVNMDVIGAMLGGVAGDAVNSRIGWIEQGLDAQVEEAE